MAYVRRAILSSVGLVVPILLSAQGASIPVPALIEEAYSTGTRARSGHPGASYWQLRPRYDLHARLVPDEGQLIGSGVVTLVNTSPDLIGVLYLRLDQNRFRALDAPVATDGIRLQRVSLNDERVDLSGEHVSGLRGTVVAIDLSEGIRPGDSMRVELEWVLEVPLDDRGTSLRQGRWGSSVFQMAQWYPRLAMMDDVAGWDTAPHDGSMEFHNAFADYRVSITVPDGWLVGATGTLTNPGAVLAPEVLERLELARGRDTTLYVLSDQEIGFGTVTTSEGDLRWEFEADLVRDFAWGASADYSWVATSRSVPHRVLVHGLATNRNREHLFKATSQAADVIQALSDLLIPYPWTEHFLVDGPEGGMEYPGVTFSNGGVVAHELTHQWFPMVVGTDESRFPFLDEGLASFFPSVLRGVEFESSPEGSIMAPMLLADDVRTVRPLIGRGRGARMLRALSVRYGTQNVLEALREFTVDWQFKHPTPWDFMNSVERSLDQDLDAFWLAWLFSAEEVRQ